MVATSKEVRIGDYFESSWGYDQTNIDYLVVVSLSPSRKTAKCQMAHGIVIDPQRTAEGLTPGVAYGPIFQMRIQGGSIYYSNVLRGSYPYISSMPTAKRLGSFYPVKLGDVSYETRSEFGH